MLLICLLLILACVVGSLPLYINNNSKILHFLLSLSAGIFIAIVFIHLIPELPEGFQGHWLLLGFSSILFVEKVVRKENKNHTTSSITAFVGLSLHAFVTGLAMGASPEMLCAVLSLPMMIHKATESISLSSLLNLSSLSRKLSLLLLAIFAFITPLGIILGPYFSSLVGKSIALELASGTFLYVVTMDLIPEIFCDHKELHAFIFFVIGITLMTFIG